MRKGLKQFISVLGVLILLATPGKSEVADIIVRFVGMPTDEGFLKAGLIKDGFAYLSDQPEEQPFRIIELPISEGSAVWVIKQVPYGEYAVQSYQDKNDNDKMDQFFMIPQEPWGFSNNHRPAFSAPSWEQSKFIVDRRSLQVLVYLK